MRICRSNLTSLCTWLVFVAFRWQGTNTTIAFVNSQLAPQARLRVPFRNRRMLPGMTYHNRLGKSTFRTKSRISKDRFGACSPEWFDLRQSVETPPSEVFLSDVCSKLAYCNIQRICQIAGWHLLMNNVIVGVDVDGHTHHHVHSAAPAHKDFCHHSLTLTSLSRGSRTPGPISSARYR